MKKTNDRPGWSNSTGYTRRVYNLWDKILRRCNNPKDKAYKYYGAIGVTVNPRWYRLSTFEKDLRKLVGYAAWKYSGPGEYNIDKDIIGRSLGLLEYGPSTCCFVPKAYNLLEEYFRTGGPMSKASSRRSACIRRGRSCYAVDPLGKVIRAYGYRELARQIPGLHHSTIQNACEGKLDSDGKVISHVKRVGMFKGWGFWLDGEGPYPS